MNLWDVEKKSVWIWLLSNIEHTARKKKHFVQKLFQYAWRDRLSGDENDEVLGVYFVKVDWTGKSCFDQYKNWYRLRIHFYTFPFPIRCEAKNSFQFQKNNLMMENRIAHLRRINIEKRYWYLLRSIIRLNTNVSFFWNKG